MNAALIYSGPVHTLSLWDSTNKELKLGYVGAEVSIYQEPIQHQHIDGNLSMYAVRTRLEAVLYETDPEKIGYLRDRQNTAQDIFVITNKKAFKLRNSFISFVQTRPFNVEEQHNIILTAQTEIANDFETITNLLSSVSDGNYYGSMEAADPPPGWSSAVGPATLSRIATFLASGGGSYALRVQTAGAEDIYADVICPLEADPITITISAYMTVPSGTEGISMQIVQLDNADAAGTTTSEAKTITTSTSTRYSVSATLTPDSDVAKLRFRILTDNAADLRIDNAQIQIGAISAYSENENV